MIDTIPVERAFQKMGANVVVLNDDGSQWHRTVTSPTINVRPIEGRETFILGVPSDSEKIQVQVLDVKPDLRHLLLQVRTEGEIRGQAEVEKFLCGHDERHWFVSAVKAKNVMEALQSLKPGIVQAVEKKAGVKRARKHKHNAGAWIRQGEWFFVPAPEYQPTERTIICKNEPISRGRGSKPHICEELAREGGTQVFTDDNEVLSVSDFGKLQREHRLASLRFRARTEGARVYVRGKIKHPDHKTITLQGWHRVELNGEIVSGKVRFLD